MLGDPTIFGNFNVDASINEAVIKQVNSFRHNGYPPADGNKYIYKAGTGEERPSLRTDFLT